jgi:hypothetical protein
VEDVGPKQKGESWGESYARRSKVPPAPGEQRNVLPVPSVTY